MSNDAVNNWIHEQTQLNISQFDTLMEENYPETRNWVKDPQASYNRICVECNYLAAVKLINWNDYLRKSSVVLDLAGGSGWLSAYLSKFGNIQKIFFLDSSKFYIQNMMPKMVEIMHGVKKKIDPIEGYFSPLLFDDSSLDTVVASSALHHADNLEIVFKEVRRVLKDDGFFFILNETPLSYSKYLWMMLKKFIQMYINAISLNYKSRSPSISSNGILYDPILGDRIYPLWYWLKAIKMSGLILSEDINTQLSTVNGEKGINLRHFICKIT
jgi:ubiquinone/menaquinone biosynthesis C-methylase UbiE